MKKSTQKQKIDFTSLVKDIPENLPTHVAIIMDGNRRWAVEHGLEYTDGHKQAIDRIEEIIEFAGRVGIAYVTFWAWSTKNWKRNKDFIDGIIKLFRYQLKRDGLFQRALEKGAKLNHIGKWDGFPTDIVQKINEYMKKEPKELKVVANFAVGYEGRDEIIRAVKRMIEDGVSATDVNKEKISAYLDTAGQPDVDFMIRTGGEKRTSGYLIWQIADAELYFTDTYMPDFGPKELKKALIDYAGRERRHGGDSKRY